MAVNLSPVGGVAAQPLPDAKTYAANPSLLIEAYRHVEVSSVSDALEQLYNKRSFMSHKVHAISDGKFAGFAVTVRALDGDLHLSIGIETTLYRIARDALTNIAKHARATEALIVIETTDNDLTLRISDNGGGVVDGENRMPGARRGVLGMRERAEAIGAQFEFQSELGRGTTVAVKVPAALERRAASAME